jgi:hypothetical protein
VPLATKDIGLVLALTKMPETLQWNSKHTLKNVNNCLRVPFPVSAGMVLLLINNLIIICNNN